VRHGAAASATQPETAAPTEKHPFAPVAAPDNSRGPNACARRQ
jgi:hypothetical protein